MATLPNPLPSLASRGLDLPSGSLVDTTIDGPWHEPLFWYGNTAAAPGDFAALRATGRPVGLLPVLIDEGPRREPPSAWSLDPANVSYPGDHDAEEVLLDFWEPYAADELGDGAGESDGERHGASDSESGGASGRAPEWPGLAPSPATKGPDEPDQLAADLADMFSSAHLDDQGAGLRPALVPARRSADIPAALGWTGPVNHESDVARLCAVLRSWEDRFDIRVVVLGFDTLTVSVGRPPTTLAEANALAAEHFAFCPDTIDQNPPYDLAAYAEKSVLNRESWSFWWD
ncbi:DUF4253 domain-containing protein [Streptomyces sp. NBC_01335]|uniref:DUF4253 domain-containing protein n=1 Tax=Streptomyces sp. NBC_01335 TaxID=2903828 RepID=UPI002E13E2B5|nr:DUF4253 domain-containing protein [Streptomyces sp. NBC_01335]